MKSSNRPAGGLGVVQVEILEHPPSYVLVRIVRAIFDLALRDAGIEVDDVLKILDVYLADKRIHRPGLANPAEDLHVKPAHVHRLVQAGIVQRADGTLDDKVANVAIDQEVVRYRRGSLSLPRRVAGDQPTCVEFVDRAIDVDLARNRAANQNLAHLLVEQDIIVRAL